MKIGDKLYRYRFDLASGRKSMDIFEVAGINIRGGWESLKCSSVKDGKIVKHGIYFCRKEFGKVKTKGSSKYVLLDHEGEEEALAIVYDYVSEMVASLQEKFDRLLSWKGTLEEWKEEDNGGES